MFYGASISKYLGFNALHPSTRDYGITLFKNKPSFEKSQKCLRRCVNFNFLLKTKSKYFLLFIFLDNKHH